MKSSPDVCVCLPSESSLSAFQSVAVSGAMGKGPVAFRRAQVPSLEIIEQMWRVWVYVRASVKTREELNGVERSKILSRRSSYMCHCLSEMVNKTLKGEKKLSVTYHSHYGEGC